ncbi:CRM-domain containing factor CFM2, chloroplastic [Linum perenne]
MLLFSYSPSIIPLTSPQFPFSKSPFLLTSKTPAKHFVRCSSSSDSHSRTLPQTSIQRIADKLRSLGFSEDDSFCDQSTTNSRPELQTRAPGEIFIPLPNGLPNHRVGHTLDPSWSTPQNPIRIPRSGNSIELRKERFKKMKEEREKGKVPTLAGLNLPDSERRRLTTVGIEEKRTLKVGKAGITEGIVNGIHERWRHAEVVKIVCEDLCKLNMKRTHDLLERKTGGLVVWRTGSKIVLYRGANYKYPYFLDEKKSDDESSPGASLVNDGDTTKLENLSPAMGQNIRPTILGQRKIVKGVGLPERVRFQLPGETQLAEEADSLLDGLGPRFTDWWGYDPLPVDADLLPAVVPGYRRPFRLLPFGIQPRLTNDEMTTLRRLSRPLPCHFALGKNRKHQGLAAAIVKLWEKCEIAKIAVKRGVQNIDSELMAEELQWLTGGTLLSRDMEFIVFYRGKDFLPAAVSSAITERRRKPVMHGNNLKVEHNISGLDVSLMELDGGTGNSTALDGPDTSTNQRLYIPEHRKQRLVEEVMKRTSEKLAVALEKKVKAEKKLAELEEAEESQKPEVEVEGISEEERYMLRKVGLKMKPFLLIGRRGVFDGTVENMHLHWKYRELVKLLSSEKNFEAAHQVGKTLEAESGGILVAVESVSKGHVIIVYRGKNYKRPASLRPQTLLNKKEALKLSLEAQRHKSLKLHVLKLTKYIEDLKENMDQHSFESYQVREELNMPANPDQQSEPVIPNHSEDNREMISVQVSDLNSLNFIDGLDVSSGSMPTKQTAQNEDSSTVCEVETVRSDPERSSSGKNVQRSKLVAADDGAIDSTASHVALFSERRNFTPLVNVEHSVSGAGSLVGSTADSEEIKPEKSVLNVLKEKNKMMPSRVQLSNRDRLILRKQALKMKNRPVLSVGKNNIITGVGKTIKAHFERYPLAIVNVKGRAKGTSVQEVVSQLEQETGAVFVSQEPSKVILYRGWGAEDEAGSVNKKKKKSGQLQQNGKVSDELVRPSVSPELMKAIRLECGLLDSKAQKHKPVN